MTQETKMDSTFFDIHMHAMDLSHPNLLAFIDRISGLGPKLVLGGLAEPFLHEKEERFVNLLTVMENSIEDYFILMEYFLKEKEPVPDERGIIRVGGRAFDTILLTPLIMDFGFKHIKAKTFYDMALGKPVVGQTVGVLNAIRKYCNSEFALKGDGKKREGITVPRTTRPLFEIYPFLGINTRNYDAASVSELLSRCFSGYTGKRDDLHAHMGTFDGVIEKVGSNVFAGIKLYPPLGFDPWPGEGEEKEKVKGLYKLCQEKEIPITAHCSDGGFAVDDNAKEYTNPEKWREVLGEYPKLKLNLAHFGKQGDVIGFIPRHAWRKTVIDLILSHDNVYTDISCLAFDDDFYKDLNELLDDYDEERRDRLSRRILFGSDYMINLLWAKSYNEYLDLFIRTERIGEAEKALFCNGNAVRFLFRE